MTRAAALVVALLALPAASQPLGGEFRVNTYTTGAQASPAVALEGDGFVVVWVGAQLGNADVFGQLFDRGGSPVGGEFRVNTTTTLVQTAPDVAEGIDGSFVVVWHGTQYGSAAAVFGQRYAASGAPLGGEFRINSSTTVTALGPRVACDAAGNFVVLWTGTVGSGISGRRYSASGAPRGAEFAVDSATAGNQTAPSASFDGGGGFVAAWASDELGTKDVFVRRFDPTGAAVAAEFRVNIATTGNQQFPAVAANAAGTFLVAWEDAGSFEVRARRYAANGAVLSAEMLVGAGSGPRAAALPGGGYVVSWNGSDSDIRARRVLPTGDFAGPEFRVNSTTSGAHNGPAVAADDRGFVVVFDGSFAGGDGSDSGIFGQRYNLERMAGDVNGDGVVNVNDVFYLINFLFAGGPAPL